MRALTELERLGYTFTLDNNAVRYRLTGPQPDPESVRPLLGELKTHKPEAILFLRLRQLPQRLSIPEWAELPEELRRQYVLE